MSDDVVSALLAAIEQRETAAKRALAGYPSAEYNMESAYLTRVWKNRYHEVEAVMTKEPTPEQLAVRTRNPRIELVADCGPANVYPARHIALNDPQSVLRLCRAHRNIIDKRQESINYLALVSQQRAHGAIVMAVEGAVEAWDEAVRALAVGYGLKTEENSDE